MIVGESQDLKELVEKIQKDILLLADGRVSDQVLITKLVQDIASDQVLITKLVQDNESFVEKLVQDNETLKNRIGNQDKKIVNQDEKIKALEIELVFVNQALDILLPREGVILAAQILLIKLGHQPQNMSHVRFCRRAYQSTTAESERAPYGAPFVAMVEEQFPDEPVPYLYEEMDIILTLRYNYAHTSPVQEVVSQSKKMVSYITHSGGKEKLNRRDSLVLRILEKAESLLNKYPCCVPPPSRT